MSQQQHGFPPPPPPPLAASSSSNDGPSFAHDQRRSRVASQPHSITTNFLRTQGLSPQSQTPANAESAGHSAFPYSPAASVASNPRPSGRSLDVRTPAVLSRSQGASPATPMAQSYNPMQWSQRGPQMGVHQQVQSSLSPDTRNVTGMEAAMPSPPPPYSPETLSNNATARSVRPSPLLEQMGFTTSPSTIDPSSSTTSISMTARGSPQIPMSPAFPPPPGQPSRHRERSASGQTGQRFFNTIQSLTNRGKQPSQSGEIQSSQSLHCPQPLLDGRPPASRRAASTGHLTAPGSTPSPVPVASGRTSPDDAARWQPGMPLPGPPPGPPPPGARSQSLNRYPTASPVSRAAEEPEALRLHRRTAAPSTLGPVPPTPADWVDGDDQTEPRAEPTGESVEASNPQYPPLRIDTGTRRDASLSRRPATRDASAQGLRERRSRSKAAREGSSSNVMSPVSDHSRLGDVVFSPTTGAIHQRRSHMRQISGYATTTSARINSPAKTPQATAGQEASSQMAATVMTPPYTPAVRKELRSDSGQKPLQVPGSASSDRPISHLLHEPMEDVGAMQAPLSPARTPSNSSVKASTRLEPFFLQALDRHRSFIEKEAAASTDEERLELFANYLVHESRLRRDRYSTAYNAMAGDIVDVTRDMWRSYTRSSKRAATPSTSMSSFDHTVPSWASDGRPGSALGNGPSSASSTGDFTPATDTASTPDLGEGQDRSDPSRQWGETFKPSLSPIPSMAVSTVADEASSRGRQQSRWWEGSNNSGSIGRPERMERTHRETKYMGVNVKELQASPQPSPELVRQTPTPGASTFALGANEYPPEKVGWHESNDFDTPMATPAHQGRGPKSSDTALEPLDVSRLVTLPPPYPRHHPAVNNNHPLLCDLRAAHRVLADREGIQEIRDAYMDQDWAIQRNQQEDAKRRRNKLRSSMQEKLNQRTISFAEAAQAEADFDAEEAERGKAAARANFDNFESSVSHPLNNLLTDRIEKANECIESLVADLESHSSASDPNQAQEEGDERPERLEKVTLLKWLFESREQLHKEMFDLHAQRAEKYGEVVLTPYRISKQTAKIEEAETFFAKDSQARQATFAKESLKRYEKLLDVMETNVTQGVEDQLSAFWDIAPGLLEVIQQVPSTSETADHQGAADTVLVLDGGFEIQIPAQEYEENPAYEQFPLQYLYSLLSHAEKSAYQFIESQINLLCLLHEVRTAATKASLRLEEVKRASALERSGGSGGVGGNEALAELKADMLVARRQEEQRLTEDLKEKVGEVERQWREALGGCLGGCKVAVRGSLEGVGGWEDGLEG